MKEKERKSKELKNKTAELGKQFTNLTEAQNTLQRCLNKNAAPHYEMILLSLVMLLM